jgi:hypothetical protein
MRSNIALEPGATRVVHTVAVLRGSARTLASQRFIGEERLKGHASPLSNRAKREGRS